jgi:diguanylate cyclase (GGDEF)-like protein
MCGGKVQGEFALKYKSCTECDVYRDAVFSDPAVEIYEHLVTLVHSLRATQDRLKTMATRDLLTGLYNRNYFNETIAREIARARRHRENISVIMIDIDNFKQINDTYGHLHGDGVLRECAGILTRAVRTSDILCRFGGDEFLIITPERDCSRNEIVVGRINSLLDEWNRDFGSADYQLSLSIGCAVWRQEGDLLSVVGEADKRMYEQKRNKAASQDRS